jgi:aspartate carbamoyltransferase catalytic subunit
MAPQLTSFVSTKDLDLELVQQLFLRAEKLKRLRGVLSSHEKALEGDTVANLFWESSTRTRTSFQLAAHRLGAYVVNLNASESSVAKGESLEDTIANLRALGCRFFVVRHSVSGKVEQLAQNAGRGTSIINAGDGTNEHPSQALLDAFTIRERKKNFDGLQMAIIGDVVRSRVAHSNMYLLSRLGVKIRFCGPKQLVPEKFDVPNASMLESVDEAVKDADIIMVLRMQREREGRILSLSDEEYRKHYGLNGKRMALAKPDAILMHPGPIIRGMEVESDVADGPQSVILRQAENGLFMRMAIFEALRGDRG